MNSRNGQLGNQIISIVLIVLSVLTLTRGWIKITGDMDSSISSTVRMLIREINDEIEDADSEDRAIYRQLKGIIQPFKDGKLSPLEIVKISGRFVRGNQLAEKYYDDTLVDEDEDILLKFKIVLFAGIVWMLLIVGLAVLIIIDKRKNVLYQWLFFGANALLVIVMIVMCIFLNQSDSDVSDFIYDNFDVYDYFLIGFKLTIVPFLTLLLSFPYNYYEKLVSKISGGANWNGLSKNGAGRGTKVCPNCHAAVQPKYLFCLQCGYDLRTINQPTSNPQTVCCKQCGAQGLPAGSTFCVVCGAKIDP